ncbi:group II intron reverse transcriptase/maturase [Variovorax sp. J22R115]|uniref:group II intron reverse transcriptase/maturase n=1 Tax=Variovorax sp. J22R115 TaxID=3053509 RepID=UPI0025775714|nr:group II intron reverse transcriptase/maturase [Variovorax sp. J22R115]MDM0054027.1 group II intron reverse transcriptase/maturase [Variovorax sp. J22R115]
MSDEATLARHAQTDCGATDLLGQALARENMARAWKRVRANKGSAGVDGRTVQETGDHLKTAWPDIRRRLLDGSYRPEPVRRVGIPKPGGGVRELGIPTVVDRLIQQALLQVLQPLIDPTFSEHSYGFRPGRSAHGAVLEAQQYVQAGYGVVVDVDLEKFFDRVNHDILMDRLAKRIADKRVLRLIRRYLQAGILVHGVHSERFEGTPQGGPLSPLLANVLLDEVDRELKRRGHKFVRYADDCNVYVRSQRAGERVLQSLRGCYAKLALKVNESKTAVGEVWGRKFLGYCLYVTSKGEVKRAVADQAMHKLRERIRQLTRRLKGRSLEQIASELQGYVPGWKSYFRLAQTPKVMRELDEWLRHRLRSVQLKQWRRGTTMFRELRKLGATVEVAARIAGNARRWWHNSRLGLNRVMPVSYFDALGVPRFS